MTMQNVLPRERMVDRRPTVVDGVSMTKQSMKDECDVNSIMSKYQKTGLVSHVMEHQGNYLDLSEGFDFHTALQRIQEANKMFMTLPSDLRAHFNNDAGYFLEFVSNPANEAAMVDLGLREKLPPAPPAEPVPPAVATPAPVV